MNWFKRMCRAIGHFLLETAHNTEFEVKTDENGRVYYGAKSKVNF